MSFLIVDDNAVMRRTIGFVVRDMTDGIIECADGAAAFSAYQKHLPEWVLMDIEMPLMDGLTATREICAAYPKAHIVIITKHEEMREAAREAGAYGFVTKENLLELREFVNAGKILNDGF